MSLVPWGIWAASGGAVAAVDSYDLLVTEILTSSQSSVTFASLGDYAADYQHLQIRMVGRSDRSSRDDENLRIRFNSDSDSNYSNHYLQTDGGSVTSGAETNNNAMWARSLTASSSPSDSFGVFVIDVLDFSNTNKNTTARTLGGSIDDDFIGLSSGAWFNTAALTSIELGTQFSNNFVARSRFSIYGIRKAA